MPLNNGRWRREVARQLRPLPAEFVPAAAGWEMGKTGKEEVPQEEKDD
jgi:hypothetical protein